MTKLGKALIFINVALSIGLAAFALGLYANRIEWGGAKPSDSDSEIARLTTDIKNRQDVLVKSVARGIARVLVLPLYVSYRCRASLFGPLAFQTSSQALQRMQGSGSSMRCLGDFTPSLSQSGSTVSSV